MQGHRRMSNIVGVGKGLSHYDPQPLSPPCSYTLESEIYQRRRKVFKTSGAIASGFIFKGAVLSKLCSKSVQKWWCHGTTGTTAYDGADRR